MKTLITAVILSTSLALSGNVAVAAATQAHKTAATTHVTRHVASARRPAQREVALPNIFGALFGLPIPVTVTGHASTHAARDTGGYDPTYDSPTYDSSPVVVDNSQSQAAIDASDQAIQQMDQNLQDLDASIAAAEQQNDAANAAALQTEINAGM
jgi:hypothetical protein